MDDRDWQILPDPHRNIDGQRDESPQETDQIEREKQQPTPQKRGQMTRNDRLQQDLPSGASL